MITRRTLETAGFFTIAAALHVSAAAIMLPDRLERGAAAKAPPAALAAGGEEIQALVSEWEAPPEVAAAADLTDPLPEPEPHVLPEVQEPPPPLAAISPVPPVAQPDAAPARPNLPEPPAASERIAPAEPELPDLREFTPPRIEVEPRLTLDSSARPDRRPERRRPEPQAQPAPQPEPQVRRQNVARESAAPAQQAGQGGQARSGAAGGGGGVSAATRASAMAQWGAQIQGCIARRAAAPRGVRQGGTVILALTVSRSGTVQGVGVAGSSGQPALDQAAVAAAQRARRCPAAPAALTEASYPFQLPVSLTVR